jgi:glycosyltransferase involved in cell wall biosynthesis
VTPWLSIVVPVYNGAAMLEKLIQHLTPVCKTIGDYEIVLVDDGSTDQSAVAIGRLAEKDRHITGVLLSRNFGQHNATLAGLVHASGAIVVTMDQDLQNPPEEIGRMIAALESGFDVVYGLPHRRAHSLYRNMTSNFSKWLSSKILSTGLRGNFSSFRIIRRWVVDEVIQYKSRNIFLDGLISWTTANVGGVEVRNERSDFESQYTLWKLIQHGFNLLVNFSYRPLQIALVIGIVLAVLGLLGALLVIILKLFYGISAQGWSSLMVVILVMGGTQLAFLGLMGEYLGRVLMNTNQSPRFIVREVKRKKANGRTTR